MGYTLDLLKLMADGLANQFGQDCEVAISDLNNQERPLLYVRNRQLSSHKGEGSVEDMVRDALEKLKSQPDAAAQTHTFLTRQKNGRLLKSSMIYIPDEKGIPRYLLSIRYDISGFIMGERSLRTLMATDSDNRQETGRSANTVQSLLDSLILQAADHVGKPVELMSKEDKADAIGYLNEKGAFLITKSGDRVAEYFGISKYTLYHYIDLKNRNKND